MKKGHIVEDYMNDLLFADFTKLIGKTLIHGLQKQVYWESITKEIIKMMHFGELDFNSLFEGLISSGDVWFIIKIAFGRIISNEKERESFMVWYRNSMGNIDRVDLNEFHRDVNGGLTMKVYNCKDVGWEEKYARRINVDNLVKVDVYVESLI